MADDRPSLKRIQDNLDVLIRGAKEHPTDAVLTAHIAELQRLIDAVREAI